MEEVEQIVGCAARAPVVGKRLAKQLRVWTRARKVNVRQGDGSHLVGGNFILNTSFQVFDFVSSPTSTTVLCKFSLNAEVLYMVHKDCILSSSWLTENGLLVDTQESCVRNAIAGLVFPSSMRCIRSVTILDLDLEPLEDGEIVLIIDDRERYSRYATSFSSRQVARLPEHKL